MRNEIAHAATAAKDTRPATQPTMQPVTIGDIRKLAVMGRLGLPLGTLVTVTGEAIPNTSLNKADAGDALFLSISSVNGKPLSAPVNFPFRKAQDSIDVAEPKIGDSFEFRGYETGGYVGVPLHYGSHWQTTGFYFKTEFLILPSE
jgi:hypothetical protein